MKPTTWSPGPVDANQKTFSRVTFHFLNAADSSTAVAGEAVFDYFRLFSTANFD
jgi:hypothetical protein